MKVLENELRWDSISEIRNTSKVVRYRKWNFSSIVVVEVELRVLLENTPMTKHSKGVDLALGILGSAGTVA